MFRITLPGNLYFSGELRNKTEMKKILNPQEAIKIAKKIKNQGSTIVLAGGFFDILHIGHIKFLENSKKYGDYLFVLLEDDDKAKKIKGKDRPINSQKKRAIILSVIKSVDYVVLLRQMTTNDDYDKIITQISPSVITTTSGDPNIKHKKRQAKLVNGKVINVISRIEKYSTTRLVGLMN